MIIDKLYNDVQKKGPVCVGLDTQLSYLPRYLLDSDMSVEDKIFEFNKKIIDATIDNVGCYKVQIACYEALGIEGMRCFSRTIKYIREKGAIAISDVKRGDISSTARQYAIGHFTGDFETDFITVNAYMGEDAVSPYYDFIKNNDKGMFILVKTSNPSGKDFQDMYMGEHTLYQQMGMKVSQWGKNFIGKCGYSSIGAVVGLTYPEEFKIIKEIMPDTFFLIPGYGAQGGTGKDLANIFKDGLCGVVNSSRGLITAHKNKTEGADFDYFVNEAVLNMKKDILSWL